MTQSFRSDAKYREGVPQWVVDTYAERLALLIVVGGEMRAAQRAYFKDRTRDNLLKSLDKERAFDALLDRYRASAPV